MTQKLLIHANLRCIANARFELPDDHVIGEMTYAYVRHSRLNYTYAGQHYAVPLTWEVENPDPITPVLDYSMHELDANGRPKEDRVYLVTQPGQVK